MKKLLSLLLMAALMCALAAPALAGTWYVYTPNGKTVNLRSEEDNSVLAQIPFGTQLIADDDRCTETAAYVTFNGKSGYVKWQYLTAQKKDKPSSSGAKTTAVPAQSGVLKNKSKGENVRQLQTMLIELGFLDGKADGSFGSKTKTAVNKYHTYMGNAPTSQMTAADMDELTAMYRLATEDEYVPMVTNGMILEFPTCIPGAPNDVYCWKHITAGQAWQYANKANAPMKLQRLMFMRIRDVWSQSIEALYDEWALTDPAAAEAQRAVYENALTEQSFGWMGRDGGDLTPFSVEETTLIRDQAIWFSGVGVNLCFDLHGMESNP